MQPDYRILKAEVELLLRDLDQVCLRARDNLEDCSRDYVFEYNDGTREFAVACKVTDREAFLCHPSLPAKLWDAKAQMMKWVHKKNDG
jgi:hypothetical protein